MFKKFTEEMIDDQLTQIAERDWKGVNICRPYRQTSHRVLDKDGNSRIFQDRAEVFATHYETAHWRAAELPPLPDRPVLFPTAELPCGRFRAYELWQVRARLKKRKTRGTDKLSNEIICLVLDTDIGFAYVP